VFQSAPSIQASYLPELYFAYLGQAKFNKLTRELIGANIPLSEGGWGLGDNCLELDLNFILFHFPALTEGAHDVLLQTSNGQFTITRALMSTDIEVLNLDGPNARCSFINAIAVGAISDWVGAGHSVVCIANND
jgi:hypothetical protein